MSLLLIDVMPAPEVRRLVRLSFSMMSDVPLLELAKLRGLEVAQRAYRLCHDAVDYLDSISQDVAEQIGYRQATSIYLARDPQTAQRLADEALARQQIGLDVRFHNRDQVQSDFHIDGEAALSTRQAASCDPYKLAHHLLQQTLETVVACMTILRSRVMNRVQMVLRSAPIMVRWLRPGGLSSPQVSKRKKCSSARLWNWITPMRWFPSR